MSCTEQLAEPASVSGLPVDHVEPQRISPLHDAIDRDKFTALVEDMRTNGWQGAPIVAVAGEDYGWGAGDPCAITGSHRLAAAREAGIDVPVVSVEDILARFDLTLAEVDERYGWNADGTDPHHVDSLRHLPCLLPDDVVAYLGLDMH